MSGFSLSRGKKGLDIHSAFDAEDDESEKPKLRPLPQAVADTQRPTKGLGSGFVEHKPAVGTKPKSKAKDFSSLLDKKPTYTPYVPPAEEIEVDPDATVEEMSMEEMMGFGGFGKQRSSDAKKKEETRQKLLELTKRSVDPEEEPSVHTKEPARVNKVVKTATTENDNDDDDDDDDDDGGYEAKDSNELPVSHEAVIKHGGKAITAMDLDPAGARIVTGGVDYKIKLWDFISMDVRMRSFRELELVEGAHVQFLKFSPTGHMLLACFASAKLKILDRDGLEVAECMKGDQYFNDLSKTYGHVSFVNEAVWHPTKKHLVLTASSDGTIRIWDTDTTRLNNTIKSSLCGKCRGKRGKRAPVLSVAFSNDAKIVAAGCEDGSMHTFSLSDRTIFLKQQNLKAHAENEKVTCLRFSRNGDLISRSTDGTVKLWNPRRILDGPRRIASDLPCQFQGTDCIYSPNEKSILTGLSGRGVAGKIIILDSETLEVTRRIAVCGMDVGVIRLNWHYKINQIAVSCSDGTVKILYDSKTSVRGATHCVNKAPRKADELAATGLESFGNIAGTVVAPHVHKIYREDEDSKRQSTKRKREKARKDPQKTKLPKRPLPDEGFGLGKQGNIRNYQPTFGMHLANQTSFDTTRDEDPREAILKYADEAAKNPIMGIDNAYKMYNNRVDPILDVDAEEEDDGGIIHKMKRFDPENKPFQAKRRGAVDDPKDM